MDDMISVGEASQTLQVSEQYIRRLLKDKKLEGKQIGKIWVVSTKALANSNTTKELKNILDKKTPILPASLLLIVLVFFLAQWGWILD